MSTSSETFYSNKGKEQISNKKFRKNPWTEDRKQTSFNTDQKASQFKVMEWITDNLDDEITDPSHTQEYNINKPVEKNNNNKRVNGEEKEKTILANNPVEPMELLLQQIGKICDRLTELEQRTRLSEGSVQDPPNRS